MKDQRLPPRRVELDDRAGVLPHVGNLGDSTEAERRMADQLALAKLSGEPIGFRLEPLAIFLPRVAERQARPIGDLQRLRRHLVQEWAGDGPLAQAADRAIGRLREDQLLLGAGDADEAQAPLFLKLVQVSPRAAVGQDALFKRRPTPCD